MESIDAAREKQTAADPENAENDAEALTPEPELTRRIRQSQAALDVRFPMVNDLERAVSLGVSNRDLSLLRHHEKNAGIRGRRVISERALAAIEAAVGLAQPIETQPGSRVRSL